MALDLKRVESFVLIVRSGSLTRAEALSGVSKATLSRQVTRLEEMLGAQLLVRTSRRVTPTEAGRAFFAHCEGLLDEVTGRLEAARTEIHEMTGGASGSLSLLSDIQFSTSFVCHVVRLFHAAYPDVRCRLDVAGQAHAPRIDEVDCYVCAEPPDLPNLVAKPLGQLNYGLYASPGYLGRHGVPQTPQDLPRHRAIVMSDSQSAAEVRLLSGTASHAYRPQAAFATNDYWVLKTFCIDGLGLALLPDFFARPEVDRGVLLPVLAPWRPEPRRIYCAFQRQRYSGRKLRAFIDLMARCVVDIDSYNFYVGTSLDPPARERGGRPPP